MAFNDGVIAIIVTLMVFNIHLPPLNAGGVRDLGIHVGIYGLSFFFVAMYWLNLHAMLDAVPCVSPFSVWTNLLLLFVLSLVPLPTQALGEHPTLRSSHVFFGGVMAVAAAVYAVLHRSVEDDLPVTSDVARLQLRRKNWMSAAVFAASPLLALVSVWLSMAIFIGVPAVWFRPSKHLSQPDA